MGSDGAMARQRGRKILGDLQKGRKIEHSIGGKWGGKGVLALRALEAHETRRNGKSRGAAWDRKETNRHSLSKNVVGNEREPGF